MTPSPAGHRLVLAKHLYVDWRHRADHFARHLVDGDVASNVGNWQWVGDGSDSGRTALSPDPAGPEIRPDGVYVRRFVRARRTRRHRRPRALASRSSRSTWIPATDRRARGGRDPLSRRPTPRSDGSVSYDPPRGGDVAAPRARRRRTASARTGQARGCGSSRTIVGVRSPSISGRATAALTGVTRWSHQDESRGVKTGTSTIGTRFPRIRAMRSIISRYVMTSGPPTSYDSPRGNSRPHAPTR